MTKTTELIERKAGAGETGAMPAGRAVVAPGGGRPAAAEARPSGADGPAGARPLARLVDAGLDVPVLGGGVVPHANLDVAATAPALAAVAERVAELLPWCASVHRGAGYASQVATNALEDARAAVARHVGARPDDVVVFTRNTTDALGLLASAVPGDTVVLDLEHHANLLPWLAHGRRVVTARSTIAETVEALRAELAARPAALVSVTGASNVTGELLPLAAIAALAHEAGARLAVDAAQLLPHRRVDLAAIGADYLAFSGHKAYAPFGAGALVGRADWLDEAAPHQAGGGAVHAVALDRVEWKRSPERHEGGTPNVLGAVAVAAALGELERLGDEARIAHEHALGARLRDGLAAVPGVRVLRAFDDLDERASVGIATLELERGSVGLAAAALAAEHGVSVRAGRFCAHPFFTRIATRANGLRASFGLGSTVDDVDRFVAGLDRIVRTGPVAEYERTADGWRPRHDDRPRPVR